MGHFLGHCMQIWSMLLRCRAINSITFFLSIFCETRDLKRLQSHKINTRKSFEICCVYSSPSAKEQGVLHDPKSDPRIRWSGPPITCCTIFAVLPFYELYWSNIFENGLICRFLSKVLRSLQVQPAEVFSENHCMSDPVIGLRNHLNILSSEKPIPDDNRQLTYES